MITITLCAPPRKKKKKYPLNFPSHKIERKTIVFRMITAFVVVVVVTDTTPPPTPPTTIAITLPPTTT